MDARVNYMINRAQHAYSHMECIGYGSSHTYAYILLKNLPGRFLLLYTREEESFINRTPKPCIEVWYFGLSNLHNSRNRADFIGFPISFMLGLEDRYYEPFDLDKMAVRFKTYSQTNSVYTDLLNEIRNFATTNQPMDLSQEKIFNIDLEKL